MLHVLTCLCNVLLVHCVPNYFSCAAALADKLRDYFYWGFIAREIHDFLTAEGVVIRYILVYSMNCCMLPCCMSTYDIICLVVHVRLHSGNTWQYMKF